MIIRRLPILVFLLYLAVGQIPVAHAQYDTIELPDNVPAVVLNGSASYFDVYPSEKAMHLTFVLHDSGFSQDERSSMIAGWLRNNGMKNVLESKDHLQVEADTDVDTVTRILGITIDQYAIGTILYYSNSKPPNIPVVANGVIKKIEGLDSFPSEMR